MELEVKYCPLYDQELFSELGLECLMCGMSIDGGEFCSMKCEKMYEEIHK